MKHCQLLCREWMSTTHHTHTIHNQTTSLIVLLACRFVVVVAIAFADDNDNDGLLFIEIVWFLYGCRTATRHTHTHTSRFHKYNSIFAYILFICWFFFLFYIHSFVSHFIHIHLPRLNGEVRLSVACGHPRGTRHRSSMGTIIVYGRSAAPPDFIYFIETLLPIEIDMLVVNDCVFRIERANQRISEFAATTFVYMVSCLSGDHRCI